MSDDATPTSTRDLILDAAEALFAEKGYQATTIKQVAEQVGVQGPALYKHFASKRALFEEVLERLFTPFTPLLKMPEYVLKMPEKHWECTRRNTAANLATPVADKSVLAPFSQRSRLYP